MANTAPSRENSAACDPTAGNEDDATRKAAVGNVGDEVASVAEWIEQTRSSCTNLSPVTPRLRGPWRPCAWPPWLSGSGRRFKRGNEKHPNHIVVIVFDSLYQWSGGNMTFMIPGPLGTQAKSGFCAL